MNASAKTRIDDLIYRGYNFRFGDYISTGFNLVQKNLGGFVVFTFIMIAIVMVVNFIPVVGAIANQFILVPAFTVGYYVVANKVQRGHESQFGDFARGFDYIGQLALAAFSIMIITIVSLIPFLYVIQGSGLAEWYYEALANPQDIGALPDIPGWSLLLLLPTIYISVAYNWTFLFIVFYGFKFWDAMEASRKLITKRFFLFFAFIILISIIAGAGILLFCIGILATIPAYFCMNYAAFEDVTKLLASETEGSNVSESDIVE